MNGDGGPCVCMAAVLFEEQGGRPPLLDWRGARLVGSGVISMRGARGAGDAHAGVLVLPAAAC